MAKMPRAPKTVAVRVVGVGTRNTPESCSAPKAWAHPLSNEKGKRALPPPPSRLATALRSSVVAKKKTADFFFYELV